MHEMTHDAIVCFPNTIANATMHPCLNACTSVTRSADPSIIQPPNAIAKMTKIDKGRDKIESVE